ncbi:hypothetical protein ACTWPB_11630 [Nocardia sp. IBHARD005]|uniref:hypothetical protein n=1 Tax=Nocardia sp. IBHARD005 TaxID=3457765 RepID=UPI00405823A6
MTDPDEAMDSAERTGWLVPVSAAVAALAVSIVAGVYIVGFALIIIGLERHMNVSGQSSGWVEAVAVILLCPALIMAAGAILMLRRQVAGRVMVSVTAALGAALMALIAGTRAIDGELASALQVAVVAAAPGIVLMLSTSRASKEWTGRMRVRPSK